MCLQDNKSTSSAADHIMQGHAAIHGQFTAEQSQSVDTANVRDLPLYGDHNCRRGYWFHFTARKYSPLWKLPNPSSIFPPYLILIYRLLIPTYRTSFSLFYQLLLFLPPMIPAIHPFNSCHLCHFLNISTLFPVHLTHECPREKIKNSEPETI